MLLLFSRISKLHMHLVDLESMSSPSTLLLQGKEVSFELELNDISSNAIRNKQKGTIPGCCLKPTNSMQWQSFHSLNTDTKLIADTRKKFL